jgi:hypothetical protein
MRQEREAALAQETLNILTLVARSVANRMDREAEALAKGGPTTPQVAQLNLESACLNALVNVCARLYQMCGKAETLGAQKAAPEQTPYREPEHTDVKARDEDYLFGKGVQIPVPINNQTIMIDAAIAGLVSALNKGGCPTKASCSGHGERPGQISLADGRELFIARNWREAREIDAAFPGINGETPIRDKLDAMDEHTRLLLVVAEAARQSVEAKGPSAHRDAREKLRHTLVDLARWECAKANWNMHPNSEAIRSPLKLHQYDWNPLKDTPQHVGCDPRPGDPHTPKGSRL